MRISFRQDPRLSSDTLILEEGQLTIVTMVAGLHRERRVKLKELSPDLEQRKERRYHLIVIPALLGLLTLLASGKIVSQDLIPKELAAGSLVFSVISLWYVMEGFRPIDILTLRDKDGSVVVDIYRPQRRRTGYYEFVTALNEQMRKAGRQ